MIGWWQLLAGQASVQPANPPILTVCEALDKAAEYDGKVVIVVGASSGTSEGSWIGEDCPGELVIDGRKWSYGISTAYSLGEVDPPPRLPNGFRWDKKALGEKLTQVKEATKLEVLPQYHYSDRWMAIYGRLEAKITRVEIRGDTRITYTGYGHLGNAPAQLVSPQGGWRRLR